MTSRLPNNLVSGTAMVLYAASVAFFNPWSAHAQQTDPTPVVVRPGAPGKAGEILPASKKAVPPTVSRKDIEFMQGMIMHHAQAVEMTALMASRTKNKELNLLGERIGHSQSSEIDFMKRWLESMGEPTEMKMDMPDMGGMDMSGMNMSGMKMSGHQHQMLMPGMLSTAQMTALKKATGAKFDRLFLTGMIQHHTGALTMVKELYDTAGSGQDADLFSFTTDVDSGQRAEIKIMQKMLEKKPVRKK